MKKIKLKFKDYYEQAKQSFWRIWKNKTIWFWGLFLSFGASSSFESQQNQEMNDFNEEMIVEFFSNYWPMIVSVILIGLIISVLVWVLSAIARVGVIRELDNKQNKKNYKLSFKKVWEVGKRDFKKILLLDLAVLGVVLIVLLVVLFLGGLAILTGEAVLMILMFVILGLGSVLFFILLAVLKPFALIKVVLSNVTIKNSFIQSWKMVKTDWREFFKLVLTLIVICAICGIVFILVVMFAGVLVSIFIAISNSMGRNMFISFFVILIGLASVFSLLVIRAIGNLWRVDVLIWWVKKMRGNKVKKVVKKKKTKTVRGKAAVAGAKA